MNAQPHKSDLWQYVTNLVYAPATGAYCAAMADNTWLAIGLVAFFSAAALLWLGLFRNFERWPTASKIAAYAAPVYIALGFALPFDVIHFGVILLMILYSILALVGSYALRGSNIER